MSQLYVLGMIIGYCEHFGSWIGNGERISWNNDDFLRILGRKLSISKLKDVRHSQEETLNYFPEYNAQ